MPLKDLLLVIAQLVLFILFAIGGGSGLGSNFWITLGAFVLTVSGILICSAGLLHLGKNLTPVPTPRKEGQLITTGIYRFVRHPIYTGIFLAAAGISLNSLSVPRAIITLILFFFFLYKSKYEEGLLISKYPDYKKYQKETGRFFPRFFSNTGN